MLKLIKLVNFLGKNPTEGKDKTLFEPNCLLCKRHDRNGVKLQNVRTSESLTNFELGDDPTIIKIAEKKCDN